MNTAKIVAVTQPLINNENGVRMTPDEFIAYCARVSNPSNQMNSMTAPKLLRYCAKHKHWSVFETVNITMSIETTRDIARQILRHRSFSFQEFCVAEGTLITTTTKSGRLKKIAIENLYKRYNSHYWNSSDNLVKVWDSETSQFVFRKINEVFKTGVKPVVRMTLANGKNIVATEDHKILTKNGFKRIGDLNTETDFVGVNGIPVHQSKEWMQSAKKRSKDNLQVLCRECHTIKSREENKSSRQTVRWLPISSIISEGEVETYDLEVDHESHNYVANGIVTHNSQRYADPTSDLGFVTREARLQDLKNRQNSIEIGKDDDPFLELDWQNRQSALIKQTEETYKWAIENGIAKEQARSVLPEGLTGSRMYVNGTLRSWIHYCAIRTGPETQKEHREIATDAWYQITEVFPSLKDTLDIGE